MEKTLDEHFGYLSDRVKLARYRLAITRLVRPGHIVLDLGCGTGLLGLMALRRGAQKVCFVEEGSIIEVARRAVAESGFADRAAFFQANSFETTLTERVDIVICDHVGYFGFDYGILALLADAKKRFLKPDGIVVPATIELKLALIESEEAHDLVGRWRDGNVPSGFSWLAASAANMKHAVELTQEALLSDVAALATLELGVAAAPYVSWHAQFRCTRDGTLSGIAGWFDSRLCDDVHMTNSPAAADRLERPQAFLPLDTTPAVHDGELVQVTVMLRHEDNVVAWIVELPESGQRFEHSTFNGLLLDNEALNRSRPDRIAKLNAHGIARQVVLSYCDGQRTIADVQALVQRDHPNLFPSVAAAVSFITQVLSWDTHE